MLHFNTILNVRLLGFQRKIDLPNFRGCANNRSDHFGGISVRFQVTLSTANDIRRAFMRILKRSKRSPRGGPGHNFSRISDPTTQSQRHLRPRDNFTGGNAICGLSGLRPTEGARAQRARPISISKSDFFGHLSPLHTIKSRKF